MYFRGDGEKPMAFVNVKIFGAASPAAYENLTAEIYFDGKITDTVNLSAKEEKKIVTGENGKTIIEAKDGKIYFSSSCCKDKVCVRSGELKKNGDFASCLPEKVIVKVIGEKKEQIDAIVY